MLGWQDQKGSIDALLTVGCMWSKKTVLSKVQYDLSYLLPCIPKTLRLLSQLYIAFHRANNIIYTLYS